MKDPLFNRLVGAKVRLVYAREKERLVLPSFSRKMAYIIVSV